MPAGEKPAAAKLTGPEVAHWVQFLQDLGMPPGFVVGAVNTQDDRGVMRDNLRQWLKDRRHGLV